jgi:hypothetical protein
LIARNNVGLDLPGQQRRLGIGDQGRHASRPAGLAAQRADAREGRGEPPRQLYQPACARAPEDVEADERAALAPELGLQLGDPIDHTKRLGDDYGFRGLGDRPQSPRFRLLGLRDHNDEIGVRPLGVLEVALGVGEVRNFYKMEIWAPSALDRLPDRPHRPLVISRLGLGEMLYPAAAVVEMLESRGSNLPPAGGFLLRHAVGLVRQAQRRARIAAPARLPCGMVRRFGFRLPRRLRISRVGLSDGSAKGLTVVGGPTVGMSISPPVRAPTCRCRSRLRPALTAQERAKQVRG